MANYQITMVRGDTLAFGLEFEGLNQDIESAKFTVKVNATDEQILFQKTLGLGISKVEAGQYVVRIAPYDTENLEAGNYHFDLEISLNNDVFTIMKGILVLEQDVTWEVE